MKHLKYITSFLLIFAFTIMIVNKCVFIGSGQTVLAFCYEMENDIESKSEKTELKKETEKFFNPLDNLVELTKIDINPVQTRESISFAEGHPSQPDLPPES